MTVAGNRLFVLNSGDGSVSVIDTDTKEVISTITGVGYASPMVASSDGRYLYMSQYDSYYVTASVKVVDTATGRVVTTVTMPKCETECWANSAGITDIAIKRLHYADTLKAWRERFIAKWDEVAGLYDERFCRMWEFYLASSEAAFRHDRLFVFQLQLARHQDAVPFRRGYIAEAEERLRASASAPDRWISPISIVEIS